MISFKYFVDPLKSISNYLSKIVLEESIQKEAIYYKSYFCAWFFVFCGTVVLYALTAQHCFSWQDSGMFQWRILHGDLAGQFGLALSHPLYILLAGWFHALPFGTDAYRLNLFSGLGMAVALANTAMLVCCLTRRIWPGIVSVLCFSVMHTPWWLSTITEVYTWNLAFFSLELLILVNLVRRPGPFKSFLLFAAAGINLSVHNMALIALPVYAGAVFYLFIKKQLSLKAVIVSALFYVMGASIYFYCFLNLIIHDYGFLNALKSALFGQYAGQVLNTSNLGAYFAVNAGLIALNFLNLVIPFFLAGLFYIKKEAGTVMAALLGMIAVLEMVFVIRFPVPDQFSFALPSLLMVMVFSGVGMHVLYRDFLRLRRIFRVAMIVSVLGPPVFFLSGPVLAEKFGIEIVRESRRPFRDEMRYWAVPWKHNECSAQQFASAALAQAAPDGVIISDNTAFYPLVLVRGQMNEYSEVDVWTFDEVQAQTGAFVEWEDLLISKSVFSLFPQVSLFPDFLRDRIEFIHVPGEVLYRVTWKTNSRAL